MFQYNEKRIVCFKKKKANGKWRKAHMYVSRVLNIATLSS